MDNISRIEDRIDKVAAGATAINMDLGGVQFKSMLEIMEFAKLMAVSGAAVPVHLRGNPGACLAICTRALRFGFDPFALAEHSFAMEKNVKTDNGWEKVETIAYDSFVIHAIIEAHAPLMGRLRMTFEGNGDERKCTVTAIARGETEPLTHTSPALGDLKKARGRNDKGQIKGSQLWDGPKSDQQLAYDTRRDFCRRYFPEVLLGWYDRDELEDGVRAAAAIDVTNKPDIASRLKGGKGKRGFSHEGVETALVEHKPGQVVDVGQVKEPVPASADPELPALLDRRAPADETADDVAEWLDEQIAIANNLKTSEELDELDPRVWKRLKDEKRAKDLGEKWETEGFNPNMNRLDPARKRKA